MLGASLDALTIGPSHAISDFMRGDGGSKPLLNMMFRPSFAGAVVGSFLGLIFKNFN